MEKVLKCNVYLNGLKDYDGMNEVFRGRFGAEPPVRTTIGAAAAEPWLNGHIDSFVHSHAERQSSSKEKKRR
jgi:enamine deaminase RidA (YjgF/YER057c/UK114 family)